MYFTWDLTQSQQSERCLYISYLEKEYDQAHLISIYSSNKKSHLLLYSLVGPGPNIFFSCPELWGIVGEAAGLPLDMVCSQNVKNVLNLPRSGLLIVIGQFLPVKIAGTEYSPDGEELANKNKVGIVWDLV